MAPESAAELQSGAATEQQQLMAWPICALRWESAGLDSQLLPLLPLPLASCVRRGRRSGLGGRPELPELRAGAGADFMLRGDEERLQSRIRLARVPDRDFRSVSGCGHGLRLGVLL